jgi:hypothetical protein
MKNRPMSDLKDQVAKTKVCKEEGCTNEFTLTYGQLAWYKEKFGDSYAEPSRCEDCRQRRREAKEAKKQG